MPQLLLFYFPFLFSIIMAFINSPLAKLLIKFLILICSLLFIEQSVKLLLITFLEVNDYNILLSSFVPVMIYNNAETDKSIIFSDNKGKSIIYMWTYKETGKIYIGSAFDSSKRLKDYYSTYYLKQANSYICKALLLHTHSAFSLSILEYIDIKDLSKEKARLLILEREQYYLDLIFSIDEPNIYNLLKEAGSRLGSKHSPETIAKLSGENNPSYGKTPSIETLIKMAESKLGEKNPNFGKTLSISTITLMSKAKIGKNNPASKTVFVYSIDSETKEFVLLKDFNTCTDAAKYFNCSISTISRHLAKNKIYKNKWILSVSLIKE
jgi:group I intron endonuclease